MRVARALAAAALSACVACGSHARSDARGAAFSPLLRPASAPLQISSRYRSPRNPERRVRPETTHIILHTTEAPAKSSLRHLSARGECHYCVTEDGSIYKIVDVWRVAFHAGTSMWNGKEDVDEYSVGIECVGYHDKPMGRVQLEAIGSLVKALQKKYAIPDSHVLTHSQVAYGNVNKWQKKKHRGRKRCGMLFATAEVRKALGLKGRVKTDPDVKAKRLVIGDRHLHNVLYGNAAPSGGPPPGVRDRTAPSPAKPAEHKAAKTAAPSRMACPPQSIADLRRQGYVPIGTIAKGRTARQAAGDRWNAPDTYYSIRGKVLPGNIIDPKRVQEGTNVWRKEKTSR